MTVVARVISWTQVSAAERRPGYVLGTSSIQKERTWKFISRLYNIVPLTPRYFFAPSVEFTPLCKLYLSFVMNDITATRRQLKIKAAVVRRFVPSHCITACQKKMLKPTMLDTRRNWRCTAQRSWRIKRSSNLSRLLKENHGTSRTRYGCPDHSFPYAHHCSHLSFHPCPYRRT